MIRRWPAATIFLGAVGLAFIANGILTAIFGSPGLLASIPVSYLVITVVGVIVGVIELVFRRSQAIVAGGSGRVELVVGVIGLAVSLVALVRFVAGLIDPGT